MKLSSKFQKILKILYVLLIVVALAFILDTVRRYVFLTDKFFYIQEYEVNGIQNLNRSDVVALSGLKIGDKLFDANLEEVEKKILRSPFVKKVHVERRLPSTVYFTIEEFEPIAYINSKPLKLITEKAVVLPRPVENDYLDLPLINLSDASKAKDGNILKSNGLNSAIKTLLQIEMVSVDLLSIISEITCKAKENEIKLINGGAKLIIPDENLDEQLLTFFYFIEKKNNLEFLRNLEYVDIRFKDRVVTKDRKKG
jgi:cell division protein FtsQ